MSETLLELAQRLNLPLRAGKNACPQCHHHSVSLEKDYFRCWRCGLRGDRVDFLVQFAGWNRAEALSERPKDQTEKERTALYQQVFAWCQKHRDQSGDYLISRGIDPDCYPHGYCPKGMLEEKLNLETLKKWGLASTKGYNLLQERLVFPVYNTDSKIIHFQGRSTEPDTELRWLSTIYTKPIHTYLFNAQRWVNTSSIPVLFICEGITDTLSLTTLGLAAVGTFGIYPPFYLWEPLLKKAEHIVLCYDSDRHPLGHPKAKEYISWPGVLENWSWVYRSIGARAYVLKPPPEYKDMNEWVMGGLAASVLERYLMEAPTVEQFSLTCGASLGAQVRLFSAGKVDWELFTQHHPEPWISLLEELSWK